MSALSLIGSIVDWGELGLTVAAATIAGVGITAAFSVAILGAAQFGEQRRQGEMVAAAGAALVAVVALTVCVAGIVFGLIVMLS
ncbi:MAG TPA: hypothetical protein VFY99_00540 [Solirubrobacterales bacterium]